MAPSFRKCNNQMESTTAATICGMLCLPNLPRQPLPPCLDSHHDSDDRKYRDSHVHPGTFFDLCVERKAEPCASMLTHPEALAVRDPQDLSAGAAEVDEPLSHDAGELLKPHGPQLS
jgi:hypothetical protein